MPTASELYAKYSTSKRIMNIKSGSTDSKYTYADAVKQQKERQKAEERAQEAQAERANAFANSAQQGWTNTVVAPVAASAARNTVSGTDEEYTALSRKRSVAAQNVERAKAARANTPEYKALYDTDGNFTSTGNLFREYLSVVSDEENEKKLSGQDYSFKPNEKLAQLQRRRSELSRQLSNAGYDIAKLTDMYYRVENEKLAQEATEKATTFGKEHPVLGTAASLGTNLFSGLGALEPVRAATEGNDIDPNSRLYLPQTVTQALRGGASSNIDSSIGKGAYNLGTTIGDMVVTRVVTGGLGLGQAGYLATMAFQSASQTTQEAVKRGATTEQAATEGIVAGIVSVACEKIGYDKVFRVGNSSTVKQLLKNSLMAFLAEGGEEATEDIANQISSQIISKGNSKFETATKQYILAGYSLDEAYKAAGKDAANEVLQSFIVGGLAGGIIGSVNSALNFSAEKIRSKAEKAATEQNAQNTQKMAANSAFTLGGNKVDTIPEIGVSGQNLESEGNATLATISDPLHQTLNSTATALNEKGEGWQPNLPESVHESVKTDGSTKLWQDEAAKRLSKVFNRNIVMADDVAHGKNGMYDPVTDTITLSRSLDSKRAFYYVAGHEITHALQTSNAYNSLERYVFDKAAVGMIMNNPNLRNSENLINALIAEAESEGRTLTPEQASQEFVADYCGSVLFQNEAELTKLAKSNGNVFQKLGQWIKDFCTKTLGTEENKQAVELRQMWQRALKTAQAETAAEPYLELNQQKATQTSPATPNEQTERAALNEDENGQMRLFSTGNTEFDQRYADLGKTYGTVKQGFNAARDIAMPKQTTDSQHTRRFFRTAAESAVTSDEVVEKLKEAAVDVKNTFSVATDSDAFETANADIVNIGIETVHNQVKAILSSGKMPKKEDIAKAAKVYEALVNGGRNADAIDLVTDLSGVLTEAGQVIQAAKLIKNLNTPAAAVLSAQKLVNSINARLRNQYGNKAPVVSVSDEDVQRLYNAKTDAEREFARTELYKNLAEQMPVDWRDKLRAWRYTAMLANPKTHIRNIAGNTVSFGVATIKDFTAGAIEGIADKSAQAAGGKGIERTKSVSFGTKFRDIAKAQFAIVRTELESTQKYNEASNLKKYQQPFGEKTFGSKTVSKALNFASNINSKALEGEDAGFMYVNFMRACQSYLAANHADPTNVDAELLEKATEYAKQQALYNTFRDSNIIAELMTKADRSLTRYARGTDNNTALRAAAAGADFVYEGIVPFKKTPLNILKVGMDYSPISLVKAIYHGAEKGGAALVIDDISKAFIGTGVMMLGAAIAHAGLAVGALDDDDTEDKFKKLDGDQNYSLRIGNKSVTVDWLTPDSLPFFAGVEFYNALSDGGYSFGEITDTLSLITAPIFELSMLSSLDKVIGTAKYSRGTGDAIASVSTEMLTSYFSQFVPTFLAQVSRCLPDTVQTVYTDGNFKGAVKSAVYGSSKMANKVPGVSANTIPLRNAWGEPIENGNAAERIVSNFVNPAYVKDLSQDPVTQAMIELYNRAQDTDQKSALYPTKPKNYVDNGDKRTYFTAEQYDLLIERTGQAQKQAVLDYLINNKYLEITYTVEYNKPENKSGKGTHTYKYNGSIRNAHDINGKFGGNDADFQAFLLNQVMEDAYNSAKKSVLEEIAQGE